MIGCPFAPAWDVISVPALAAVLTDSGAWHRVSSFARTIE